MIVLRLTMTHQALQHLINGGNIARFKSFQTAQQWACKQPYYTAVLLGCDGCFWVAATPRIARRLMAAGYEAA